MLRSGGELGLVVGCSSGGERWVGWGRKRGRRRRNRGRECWQSGYILAFTDGITDGHFPLVYLSVILQVNVQRHCTEIPV